MWCVGEFGMIEIGIFMVELYSIQTTKWNGWLITFSHLSSTETGTADGPGSENEDDSALADGLRRRWGF